ncbi:MAG: hypothetical protein Q8L48_31665 [Archangium sp.]|nr:hypothetical protein [Archangium sp.]
MANSISAQATALEHAVLTLLGEQQFDTDEPTQPGTPAGKPDPTNEPTKAPNRRKRAAVFPFAERRAGNELPWSALVEGLTP